MKDKSHSRKHSKPEGDKGEPKDKLPRQVFDGVWHDLQRFGILGNLAVGIVLLLVGPMVLYFINGLRGAVVAAGIGLTFALWLLVVIICRQIPADPKAQPRIVSEPELAEPTFT